MLNIFEDSTPPLERDVLEWASKGLVPNVRGRPEISVNLSALIAYAYERLCDRVARDGANSAKAHLFDLISSSDMPLREASALDTFVDSLCESDFFACAEAQERALGRALQDFRKAEEHLKNAGDRLTDNEAAWRISCDQFREVAGPLAEWDSFLEAQRDSDRPLPTIDFRIPKYVSLNDELKKLGAPEDLQGNVMTDAIASVRRTVRDARDRNFPGVPLGLARLAEEFRKLRMAASSVFEARHQLERASKECEGVKEHYVKLRGQLQADMNRCAGTIGASALYVYCSMAGRAVPVGGMCGRLWDDSGSVAQPIKGTAAPALTNEADRVGPILRAGKAHR